MHFTAGYLLSPGAIRVGMTASLLLSLPVRIDVHRQYYCIVTKMFKCCWCIAKQGVVVILTIGRMAAPENMMMSPGYGGNRVQLYHAQLANGVDRVVVRG